MKIIIIITIIYLSIFKEKIQKLINGVDSRPTARNAGTKPLGHEKH